MDSMLKGLFGGNDDDESTQRKATDFVSRYETGKPHEGIEAGEVHDYYSRVAENAPDDVFEQSAEQAFGRMDPDQRSELGKMLQQRMGGTEQVGDDPRQLASLTSRFRKQEPGGLPSLFGGGGSGGGGGISDMLGSLMGTGGDDDNRPRRGDNDGGGGGLGGMLDNPLAKAALGGIAAMAFKNMMSKR